MSADRLVSEVHLSSTRFDDRVEGLIQSTVWLLPVLFILSPKIQIVGPAFRLGDVLAGVLIVCHLWLSVRRREFKLEWIGWIYVLLRLSAVASIAWGYSALHIPPNIRDVFELPKLVIFYLTFRVARSASWTARDVRKVGWSVILASLPVFVLSVYQYVDVPGVNDHISPLFASPWHVMKILSIGRAVGTFGNPNYLAFFLIAPTLIIFAFLAGKFPESPRDTRGIWGAVVYLLFLAAAFGLASSRTALVAIAAAVGACAFLAVRVAVDPPKISGALRSVLQSLVVVSVVLMIGINAVQYLPSAANSMGLLERLEVGYDEVREGGDGSYTNFAQRLERWGIAVDEISESPVFGRGPAKEMVETLDLEPTDNEYLYHAARYGILGLMFYLMLYVGMFVSTWRLSRKSTIMQLTGDRALALVMFGMVFSALLFGIMAGTFYNLQIWPMMMFGYGMLLGYAQDWDDPAIATLRDGAADA